MPILIHSHLNSSMKHKVGRLYTVKVSIAFLDDVPCFPQWNYGHAPPPALLYKDARECSGNVHVGVNASDSDNLPPRSSYVNSKLWKISGRNSSCLKTTEDACRFIMPPSNYISGSYDSRCT